MKELLDIKYKELEESKPILEVLENYVIYKKKLDEILIGKERLNKKEFREEEKVGIIEHSLPKKMCDPRNSILPVKINGIVEMVALVDTGASVSVLPYSLYKDLGLGEDDWLGSFEVGRDEDGNVKYGPVAPSFIDIKDDIERALAMKAYFNPFKNGNEGYGSYKKVDGDGDWHARFEIVMPSGRKFNRAFKTKTTTRKLSGKFKTEDVLRELYRMVESVIEALVGRQTGCAGRLRGSVLIIRKDTLPDPLTAEYERRNKKNTGRINFARALVEISIDNVMKQKVSMAIPVEDGTSYIKEVIRVEYEWKPTHCTNCKTFGHSLNTCPKCVWELNQVLRLWKIKVMVLPKLKGGKTKEDNCGVPKHVCTNETSNDHLDRVASGVKSKSPMGGGKKNLVFSLKLNIYYFDSEGMVFDDSDQCRNIPINGTCLKCNIGAGNSFTYDPNPESFNEVQSISNPPPQTHYNIYLCQICETIAITFDLPTVEPKDSLRIGDEHLDTIPDTKSDEFIKSSIENLVPNPSESEDLSRHDDESFSDEDISNEIYLNPLFDKEIISIKIDPHHFNVESDLIEFLLNHDSLIISSSSKIDSLLDEFAGELILLKLSPPGIDETDCDPKEEILIIEKLLYDNSYPQIDLSFTPDDLMPPGIEKDDYDSEVDMLILNELLSNDSLSLPKNESFHFDIPSSPRPPAKPPNDDEIEPNSRILTVKMVGDISEHYVPMPSLLPTQPTNDSNQEKSPHLIYHQGLKAF
nr:hypothetical protein [Tanacetum cinerariifolium]